MQKIYNNSQILKNSICSVITGTGSYIPSRKVHNDDFLGNEFYDLNGNKFENNNQEIIGKFEKITEISERRYVTDDLVTSDIAFSAGKSAISSSGIDPEQLDYIIVAHNFGDIQANNKRSEFVPTLAARVKHKLGIHNPGCIPYDLPFGCPGWLQGMIQADYFIKSGDAKKIMVIGAETLSRVIDPHDRDGMIYADGAGATIVESKVSNEPVGILSHCTRSYCNEEAFALWMDHSFNPTFNENLLFLKMHGRKLYEYALKVVPQVIKESMEKAGIYLKDIYKLLIHQANAKMDKAILDRLYNLFGEKQIPQDIMPMTISWLGNSSVATVPTLLDLFFNGKLDNHSSREGSILVFASVGAGMNINSMVYKSK